MSAESALEAIAATVPDRLVPGARANGTRRLTGGVSADVHAVELELPGGTRRTVVVRRHRAHEGKPLSLGAARTEFRLLEWLYHAGLPVPEPLLLDDSGDPVPEPFVVMSFVDGTTEVPAAGLDACLDTMARALIRLHGLPTSGLPLLPVRRDPLPELFEFLPEGEEWHQLREHLQGLDVTAYEGSNVLVHGDFWPGNLLWRDGKLVAILDWEDAAVGDPLSDVACSRLELCYKFGLTGAEKFTRTYAAAGPVDVRRLALWDVYVAAAAQKFMGGWGLDASLEAHMRSTALDFIRAAAVGL